MLDFLCGLFAGFCVGLLALIFVVKLSAHSAEMACLEVTKADSCKLEWVAK